jgi:hypothetical protein
LQIEAALAERSERSVDELPWTTVGRNSFYRVVTIPAPWLIDRFNRRAVFEADTWRSVY